MYLLYQHLRHLFRRVRSGQEIRFLHLQIHYSKQLETIDVEVLIEKNFPKDKSLQAPRCEVLAVLSLDYIQEGGRGSAYALGTFSATSFISHIGREKPA
jgi:hypothetical protein